MQTVQNPNVMGSGNSEFWMAECPVGLRVIGGGVGGQNQFTTVRFSRPQSTIGWYVGVDNDSNYTQTITAYAICAPTSS